MPPKKNPAAVALGRLGGQARARRLSPQQRSQIAKRAATAATRARKRLDPKRRTALARKAARSRWRKKRAT